DMLGDIDLTVSDVRESILANLKKRFATAGIKKYKCFIADLTKDDAIAQQIKFDLVIADVPCSGSGTWSRTPEQLFYFDETKIEQYAALQKKILSNVIPAVRPGGFLLYITCSVFAKENEDVIDFITQQTGLVLVKSVLLKGYEMKADTMFAALLQKTL
ncbi:MAG TPA: Fmu (Sun) domain protein, partial [Chitinophagaceae bacterium]|nr:Fmu (Sun) domain protein [Chitinophagaceae bacterium]